MTRSLLPSLFGDSKKNRPVFQSLHDEIDRVFDDFCSSITSFGDTLEFRKEGQLTPKIDISETDELIEVTAEIPGVKEEDLVVSITNNALVIKGEKTAKHEEKEKEYHLVERSYGSYLRSIPLGFDVTMNEVEVDFSDGVLKVAIPIPVEIVEQVRKVPINNMA